MGELLLVLAREGCYCHTTNGEIKLGWETKMFGILVQVVNNDGLFTEDRDIISLSPSRNYAGENIRSVFLNYILIYKWQLVVSFRRGEVMEST